jgi:hypothetical protein
MWDSKAGCHGSEAATTNGSTESVTPNLLQLLQLLLQVPDLLNENLLLGFAVLDLSPQPGGSVFVGAQVVQLQLVLLDIRKLLCSQLP